MGHPPIPDYWPLIFMDEEENEQGYDGDDKIGTFFYTVYYEPPLHADNEEELVLYNKNNHLILLLYLNI